MLSHLVLRGGDKRVSNSGIREYTVSFVQNNSLSVVRNKEPAGKRPVSPTLQELTTACTHRGCFGYARESSWKATWKHPQRYTRCDPIGNFFLNRHLTSDRAPGEGPCVDIKLSSRCVRCPWPNLAAVTAVGPADHWVEGCGLSLWWENQDFRGVKRKVASCIFTLLHCKLWGFSPPLIHRIWSNQDDNQSKTNSGLHFVIQRLHLSTQKKAWLH